MPINSISATIDLSVNGSKYVLDSYAYQGYSLDLNLDSTDGEGDINIYCQNTDPETDTFTRPAKQNYAVAGGTFNESMTSQTIDSAMLTASRFCVIVWSGTGTGTLGIVGLQKFFL